MLFSLRRIIKLCYALQKARAYPVVLAPIASMGNAKLKQGAMMEKHDLLDIAEGLRLIEEGVMRIQGVMRSSNIKSLGEVAAELIPIFQEDDDALTDSLIKKLDSK
jgi:hypothetical protein